MITSAAVRTAALCAFFALACVVPRAAADAIVYQNFGGLWGYVELFDGDHNFESTGWEFFPGAVSWPYSGRPDPPLAGTWTDSEARTISGRGATGSASTSITGTLSSIRFSGSGRVGAAGVLDPAIPTLGATGFGQSWLGIAFQLVEPHTFTYSARHFGESETRVFGAWGTLQPSELPFGGYGPFIFADDFRGLPGTLDMSRTYSGVLAAGYYQLSVGSSALVSTPELPGARASGGFDTSFELTPVPEPTTLALFAAGLAAIARRHRASSRQG